MRTLKFIVNEQIINKDSLCDFSDLVPGSDKYIAAKFSFSSEWNGYVKVAEFTSAFGKEYTPQLLQNDCCLIPAEALQKRAFKIRIIGKKDNTKIQTNKIEVKQNGGIK